jgi:hypothetical protein
MPTLRQPALNAGNGTALYARLSPLLMVLALAIIVVPEEASFFVGGLRLTLARAILLALTPLCFVRFIQQVGRGDYRFVWSDALVLPAGVWMLLAVSVTEGAERALVGAGVTALEFVGAYYVARTFLTAHGQALRLARVLSLSIAVVGLLSVLDRFAGYYVLHDVVGKLTGLQLDWRYDERYGSIRAAGTFEHPILLGSACTFAMLLATTLPMITRFFVFAGAAVGLLAAVSSAPMVGAFIGFCCLVYRRLTPSFEARWRWLMLGGGILLALLFAVHSAPFGWLIGHATIDPATGFYRLLIWQVAGAGVLEAPIFGIGITDDWARPDWMPSTVDSLWLRAAMMFGIPGSLMIAACLLGACSRRVDTVRVNLSQAERRLGLALSLIMFLYIFLGFTVHFWGAAWILMGLFAGMRAHLGALGSLPVSSLQPREMQATERQYDRVAAPMAALRIERGKGQGSALDPLGP